MDNSIQQRTDDFPVFWRSLSDAQREFLLATYEIDRRLPHSDGLDKVVPPIGWRSVGLMCGVGLTEVDDFVRTLADLRLVLILDAEMREMGLICGQELWELISDERRKRWNRATILAAVLATVATLVWLFRS